MGLIGIPVATLNRLTSRSTSEPGDAASRVNPLKSLPEMAMRLFRYAALLGVSVLALSCGGSDDDSSGGGPTTPDKVRVNPSEAAVERGKTVTLTAEVLDASGRLVSGTGV